MSFVSAGPELMAAAAGNLANIGSAIDEASAAAALPTTNVVAAGTDEVSATIAQLFTVHARAYQGLSAQAAAFHQQFVALMNDGAARYASTESKNASQAALNAINAPAQSVLGRG